MVEEGKKMSKQASRKKVVSGKVMTLLGIMGITGLILLALGVFAIFEISKPIGIILLVIGVLDYVIFVLIEKKLKILGK